MKCSDSVTLVARFPEIDPALLVDIGALVRPQASSIARKFYSELLDHERGREILDHELVEERLRASLAQWIGTLFSPRDPAAAHRFVADQARIGDLHARVGVPLELVTLGTRNLKRQVFRVLVDSDLERQRLAEALAVTDELVDLATGVMNRVYLSDVVADARDQQSLRLQYLGVDMALQTEGLRASLFDWHRQILRWLFEAEVNPRQVPAIRKTSFGLWVRHKVELLLQDSPEVGRLRDLVRELDEIVTQAFRQQTRDRPFHDLLDRLDDRITEAGTLLASITETTLAQEAGRDTLTRLFNRRFMRAVLQREIRMSQGSGEAFGVALIDLDHFKRINDTWGHDTGDAVLQQFAELLVGTVRAGDFVFRYGGEEFLVVVASAGEEELLVVAEKIHQRLRERPARLSSGSTLDWTVSIGLAVFDGHPDYETLLAAADAALYRAKEAGRNRSELASP